LDGKLTPCQQKTLIESRADLIDAGKDQKTLKEALGYKNIVQGNDVLGSEIPKLPLEVLKAMMSNSSEETKKVLLVSQIQYLNDSAAIQLLKHADIDFTQGSTVKKSFKVDENRINTLLVKLLRDISLIYPFKNHDAKLLDLGRISIEIFVKRHLSS
jgi:transaldolase